MASDPKVVMLEREHLPGVIELFAGKRWSYADDEQRAWRALAAPGTLSLVALESDQAVIGIAQVLGGEGFGNVFDPAWDEQQDRLALSRKGATGADGSAWIDALKIFGPDGDHQCQLHPLEVAVHILKAGVS